MRSTGARIVSVMSGCVVDDDKVQEQEKQDREIDCLEMLDCGRKDRAKVNVRLRLPESVVAGQQRYISTTAANVEQKRRAVPSSNR